MSFELDLKENVGQSLTCKGLSGQETVSRSKKALQVQERIMRTSLGVVKQAYWENKQTNKQDCKGRKASVK